MRKGWVTERKGTAANAGQAAGNRAGRSKHGPQRERTNLHMQGRRHAGNRAGLSKAWATERADIGTHVGRGCHADSPEMS